MDLAPRLVAAVLAAAEPAESTWRIGGHPVTRADYLAMTTALGYGDDQTEPAIRPDQLLPILQEQARDAEEWREHELWRADCHAAGHPDDQDCYEHDPHLAAEPAAEQARAGALTEAEAALDRVRALDTGYSGGGNQHAYCIDPRALRAALAEHERSGT